MAKHDIFLVDGIIDDRIDKKIPSNDKGEVFELFAVEQILKDYDLSQEQLLDNSVDGRNDGGIDFIFYFVNGQLVADPSDFPYPKNNAIFETYLITCKHADSFKLTPVDSIYSSIVELFDYSIKTEDLSAQYNEDIHQKRADFLKIYKKTAVCTNSSLRFNVIYACRGNEEELADNVCARANQVETAFLRNFSDCEATFSFWGSSKLLSKYRKSKKYDIDLPIEKVLSKGNHGVVLTTLQNYYDFIIDDEGKLRRYLFDSNVRDYTGLNRVNEDILETLKNHNSSDFWLLNNGITMLVNQQIPMGEVVSLSNIQIVNGLQTTFTIYDYFSSGGSDPNNRCILIKIIKSEDASVRDSIIKATNNQTEIAISSLHATDKIQRDIEEIMLRNGLYYERKVKFYENMGISSSDIFSPLYMAGAYVSLILKLPFQAVSLKQKFMNNPELYELVFSEETDLNIWPKLAKIYRKTDEYLTSKKPNHGKSEKFKKHLRHALAFFTVANKLGTYAYSIADILRFDIDALKDTDFDAVWIYFKRELDAQISPAELSKKTFFIKTSSNLSSIASIQALKRIRNPFAVHQTYILTEDFLNKVKVEIPPQPWEVGMHRVIAEKLGEPPSKVYQAIDVLIERGLFYNQIDGVLYKKDGQKVTSP